MLARRLTTLRPAMILAEAIEPTRIHSVAGLTGNRTAVVTTRPCRAPHHTISDAGLIGGGHVPGPGEVSGAHHGVCAWMICPSAAATSWRWCGSCLGRVFYTYNLPHVIDLLTLAGPAV
jgi:Magnesium chelatase, subunit ChlI